MGAALSWLKGKMSVLGVKTAIPKEDFYLHTKGFEENWSRNNFVTM